MDSTLKLLLINSKLKFTFAIFEPKFPNSLLESTLPSLIEILFFRLWLSKFS